MPNGFLVAEAAKRLGNKDREMLFYGLLGNSNAVEYLNNGSFEELLSGKPAQWGYSGGTYGTNFMLSEDSVSGNYSLEMTGGTSIFTCAYIYGLEDNAEYTITAYEKIKELDVNSTTAVKLEFLTESNQYLNGAVTRYFSEKSDDWQKISITFTTPKDTDKAQVLLRLFGGGKVYWDNVSVIKGSRISDMVSGTGTEEFYGLCWEKEWSVDGEDYILMQNSGTERWNYVIETECETVQLLMGSGVTFNGGTVYLTVNPGELIFIKKSNGVKDGIYKDGVLLGYLSEGNVSADMAVLYNADGIREIVKIYKNGDTVKVNASKKYIMKFFKKGELLPQMTGVIKN